MVDGWMDYDCRCFQLSCGHSVNEDDHFYPLSVFVIESTDQVITHKRCELLSIKCWLVFFFPLRMFR